MVVEVFTIVITITIMIFVKVIMVVLFIVSWVEMMIIAIVIVVLNVFNDVKDMDSMWWSSIKAKYTKCNLFTHSRTNLSPHMSCKSHYMTCCTMMTTV